SHNRLSLEVRNHALELVLESPCLPFQRSVAAARPNASAPEIGLQRMKHLGPIPVLADGKARPHLPACEQLRPRRDRDRETSFPINVSGNVDREELAAVPRAGV